MENKVVFRLYITGHTPASERAIVNLKRICDKEFGDVCNISIIDVLEYPQLAEEERILATPTLIKELPPPCRRVVGDLSDEEKFLTKLALDAFNSR